MFQHGLIGSLDDYFISLDNRKGNIVYFYRISRFSGEVDGFVHKYYESARKSGVVLDGKIQNPDAKHLSYYGEMMGMEFEMSLEFIQRSIAKWLPRLDPYQNRSVSEAIFNALDTMRKSGKNDNILKNTYIKYMCWMYYKFERVVNQLGAGNVPKILYFGSVSSYELYILHILSISGCDVVLLETKGDEEYVKLDSASEYSKLYEVAGGTDFPEMYDAKKLDADFKLALTTPNPVTRPRPVSNTPAPAPAVNTASVPQQSMVQQNSVPQQPVAPNSAPGNTQPGAAQSKFHFKMVSNQKQPAAVNNNPATNNAPAANVQQRAGSNVINGINNCTNAWAEFKPFEDIKKGTSARGDDSRFYYNCFYRINGVEDKITYANDLFQLQLAVKNSGRNLVIVDEKIPIPTTNEISQIKRKNYNDFRTMVSDLALNIVASTELQSIERRCFVDVMTEEATLIGQNNINKLVNKAVYLLCWLKRYQGKLFNRWKLPDVACFIHMGACADETEALFVRFLAMLPVDVLILVPNLSERCLVESSQLLEQTFENSMVMKKYPQSNSGLHIGTAAYHAERELDSLLYSDSGMFREQQYMRANPIPLTTMYEEIKILWDQELKYRPNFSTVDDFVNIPVIFSKISGIKDGDVDKYWYSIKELMTPDAFVIKNIPYISATSPNNMKMYVTEFCKNGQLQRNKIKDHKAYQYGFIREEMQEHMLDKLQYMLDERLIKGMFENGTEYTVISTVLNLNKDILRAIQRFDFTKKNPKMIYINPTEELSTIEDTIVLTFLHLIGFDIIIFVATGYQSIERYLNQRLMEEHQIGEFIYDLKVPDFNSIEEPVTGTKESLVKNILKRGISNGFRF